jgi:hypothetical protein
MQTTYIINQWMVLYTRRDLETLVQYPIDKLGDINWQDETKVIGAYAFEYNKHLESIDLPHHILTIERYAFSNMDKLTSIYIGPNVSNIQAGVFAYSKQLSSIEVSLENIKYQVIDDVLYTFDLKTLISAAHYNSGVYHVHENVITIFEGAFASSKYEDIHLPSTVKTIQTLAFANMTQLNRIYVNSFTAPTITNDTFKDAKASFVIILPLSRMSHYESNNQWKPFIARMQHNTNRYTVIFDGGDGQLQTGMEKQTVLHGLDAYAPTYVKSGHQARFSQSFDYVMNDLFVQVTWVKLYTVVLNQQGGMNGSPFVQAVQTEKMPNALAPTREGFVFLGYFDQIDGAGLQYYSATMTSVRAWDKAANGTLYAAWVEATSGLRYTLKSDQTYEITGYTGSSTTVIVPNFYLGKPVTSIGASAFLNKTHVISIELPDTIITIKDRAFEGMTKLEYIKIPESVESISDTAFKGTSSLSYIDVEENNPNFTTLNGGLYNKDLSILYHVPALLNIQEIPLSVIEIKAHAFYENQSITSIFIHENIEMIGSLAFFGCHLLDTIEVDSNNTVFASIAGVLYLKDMQQLITYPSGRLKSAFYCP